MADSLSAALPTLLVSMIPIVLGGVITHCKLFICSLDDFRNRIRLKNEDFFERVSSAHTKVIDRANRIKDTDELLRGDGKNEPDLILEYSQKVFQYFRLATRLEILGWFFRQGYMALFLSLCVGIAAVISSLVLPEHRQVILYVDIVTIVAQLTIVGVLFYLGGRLDLYEDLS